MSAAGFTGDDQLLEPTPIAPLPDLGPVRRERRRRRLLLLWSTVALLLVGQVAVVLTLRARRTRRKPPPALSTSVSARDAAPARVADAAPATQPTSLAVASRPTPDAAVALDIRVLAKKNTATIRTKNKISKIKTKTTVRPIATRPKPEPLPVAAGPVDDVAVPAASAGNAAKGERLLRMGCGLCHGRRAKPVNPGRFTAKQWKVYFARAAHGQHDKLRGHFTRAELADVKAYLISAAGGR